MARERLAIEIVGDAGSAEAALAGVGAQLDALGDKRIDLRLEDADLRAKLLEDKAQIAELSSEEGRVRLGLSDEEAKAKIEEVKADIASIGLRRQQIQVETAGALAKVAELKAAEDTIRDKHVELKVDTDKSHTGLTTLGQKFDEVTGKIPTMVAAAGLLGPAIVPAAAAATAGIGALLVPLTAGALGFGALGLAAIPVLQDLKTNLQTVTSDQQTLNTAMTDKAKLNALAQLQHDMAAIPPDQRQVLQGVLDLKTSLGDLSASVRPQLLAAFSTGLGVAHTALSQMPGPAREAALALNDLGQSAERSLQSPAWLHFLDVITPQIRPAIDSIGRSFGNLVKGLGGVVEAFAPFAGAVESGMERITRAFANWGTGLGASAGFQHFMDYLRQNGPQLRTTIEDVGRAGESLVKAFAAFGGVNLKILDDLAKAISAVASAPGGAVALEIAALALSAGKLAGVARLGTIVTDLTRLSGAIRAFAGTEGLMASIKAFFEFMGSGKAKIPTETPGTLAKTGDATKTAGNDAENAAKQFGGLVPLLARLPAVVLPVGTAVTGLGIGLYVLATANKDNTKATNDQNKALAATTPGWKNYTDSQKAVAPIAQQNAVQIGQQTKVLTVAGGATQTTAAAQTAYNRVMEQGGTAAQAQAAANRVLAQSAQQTGQAVQQSSQVMQGAAVNDSNAIAAFAQKAGLSFSQAQAMADAGAKGIIDAFSRMPGPISADSLAAMQGLLQAINTGGPQAQATASAVVNNITGDFDQLPGGLSTAGIQAMTALVNAISTNDNNVIGAAEDAVTRAINAAKGIAANDGAAVGQALDQGIITGLQADAAAVGASAAQVAQEAGDLAKAQASIGSPSRVWRDEIGRPMAQGLALGLLDGRADVGRAAQALAGHAFASATGSFGGAVAGPSSFGGLAGGAARIVQVGDVHVHVEGGAGDPAAQGDTAGRSFAAALVRELRAT